jgi:hypothetical protein
VVLLPGWPAWGESALLYGGVLLVWLLGLYVATRGPASRITLVTVLAMFSLSMYLLGQALGGLAPDTLAWARWLQVTWWAAAIGPALWLTLTLALFVGEGPAATRPGLAHLCWSVASVALVVGALLGVVGSLSDLVEQWSTPLELSGAITLGDAPQRHTLDGLLFPVFRLYALACLLLALASIAGARAASEPGTPLRARFSWLLVSGTLFLLGVVALAWFSSIYAIPGLLGHALLILGMLIMGWNVARYGALLAGEVVRADLLAFTLSMVAIVVLYGGLMLLLTPHDYGWLARLLPILLVLMVTHVVVDTRGHLLDRLLFGPVVATLRGQLRGLANRVVRQPDAITALADVRERLDGVMRTQELEVDREPALAFASADGGTSKLAADAEAPAEFRLLVEGAFRRMDDLPSLSRHPLAAAPGAAPAASPLEGASALRSELALAIERLRPGGARPTPGSDGRRGGWLPYLVLYEAYVEGRPNKQIMQRYYVSEGTFHRTRRRAIDAVASDLYISRQRSAVRGQRSLLTADG